MRELMFILLKYTQTVPPFLHTEIIEYIYVAFGRKDAFCDFLKYNSSIVG